MNVKPLQPRISASDIAPEQLAGNPLLTQEQKISEASRQFEAVLLRQILGDAQKTVFKSEFSDNSTASGIYQDLITKSLADDISKSGAFGLAQTFERQLNRPTAIVAKDEPATATASALPTAHRRAAHGQTEIHVLDGSPAAAPSRPAPFLQ
jgi:Rod binding domain-containing protein